jgi:hypothetical protein
MRWMFGEMAAKELRHMSEIFVEGIPFLLGAAAGWITSRFPKQGARSWAHLIVGGLALGPAFPRCTRCWVRYELDFGILYKGIVGISGAGYGWRGR